MKVQVGFLTTKKGLGKITGVARWQENGESKAVDFIVQGETNVFDKEVPPEVVNAVDESVLKLK